MGGMRRLSKVERMTLRETDVKPKVPDLQEMLDELSKLDGVLILFTAGFRELMGVRTRY